MDPCGQAQHNGSMRTGTAQERCRNCPHCFRTPLALPVDLKCRDPASCPAGAASHASHLL
eukprot:365928-Chlamydomonas_euryale.AAC.2